MFLCYVCFFFFFKQKTAYDMRISDWSSDVCSSDLAMSAVVMGRDSLLVLPTGGGKSLCFQAPALTRDGLALVVSPLIALMKDQIGRASWRERVCKYVSISVVAGASKKKIR